jgi:hypothetical protein
MSRLIEDGAPTNPEPWREPRLEELHSPLFAAIWQRIKTWDINVPGVYAGYCGATGNHVVVVGYFENLTKNKHEN